MAIFQVQSQIGDCLVKPIGIGGREPKRIARGIWMQRFELKWGWLVSVLSTFPEAELCDSSAEEEHQASEN